MESEWDRKKTQLVNRFPRLYRLHRDGMAGFGIDKGWFPLLERLSSSLTEISLQHGIRITARDIKQKWGTLRFYYSVETPTTNSSRRTQAEEEIRSVIATAEAESAVTCEKCGRPGALRKGRGWRVSCDRCHRS